MTELLCFLIVLANINVAILSLFGKWGIITQYRLRRPRWLPEACNFCFFFWVAFIQLLCLYLPEKGTFSAFVNCFLLALATSTLSLYFKPKPIGC